MTRAKSPSRLLGHAVLAIVLFDRLLRTASLRPRRRTGAPRLSLVAIFSAFGSSQRIDRFRQGVEFGIFGAWADA